MTDNEMTVQELISVAEAIAKDRFDGHLTLMKFTTGWKAAWGTPDLDSGDGRSQVARLKPYPSLEDALKGLLRSPVQDFYDFLSW